MQYKEVEINEITVPNGHRKTSQVKVKEIADSILSVGLLHPIGLNMDHKLIYGRHRLEAFIYLGRSKIPAMIHQFDDLHAQLAVIDENILRKNLNAAEESKALSRRKEIYETLYPETKQHKAGGHAKHNTASDNMSFAEDTASKTGQSRRTIERKVEIGEKLSEEVIDLIADSPIADNQSELKLLAEMPADEQLKTAKAISEGKIKSIKQHKKKTSVKGSDGRPQNVGPLATDAMSFAQIAISYLESIRADDPAKRDALIKVIKWIFKKEVVWNSGIGTMDGNEITVGTRATDQNAYDIFIAIMDVVFAARDTLEDTGHSYRREVKACLEKILDLIPLNVSERRLREAGLIPDGVSFAEAWSASCHEPGIVAMENK